MSDSAVIPRLQHLFDRHKACVLLPTYNNAGILAAVIQRCLEQTTHVVVVNDGSTDQTASIIKQWPVQVVQYANNQGKGYALRQGFRYAIEQGYDFVLTIDTDGQHYPEDAVHFFNALDQNPDSLLIGSRNLNQENVPGKSSFGNRFSNFWFKVETGKTMPDTQS
ncbi:MAG: glycosyltransferase family 2 protein, partial [Chitinophagaceae bacterium]|nr:glycosyltransferase family 2 protein [Chitinophagaceae bacterium]